MSNARKNTEERPVRRLSAKARALAERIGEAPPGLLCGDVPNEPSDASYRVARGLLGTVGKSGAVLDRDRTHNVASLLERLQRADRKRRS